MNIRKALPASAMAVLLAGCALGPDYQRPATSLPDRFNAVNSTDSTATQTELPSGAEWWRAFNDAKLDELIERALRDNRDLQIAAAQLDEAEALLRQTNASLLPQIDATGSGGRTRVSQTQATPIPANVPVLRDDRRAVLSTAFELDLWGRLRRLSEAGRAQLLASRHARDGVALTLSATTAQAYFNLRSTDAQLAALGRTAQSRRDSLGVVRTRHEAGLASALDLNQARGNLADAEAQLSELQRQRDALEHLLAGLVGDPALRLVPVNADLPSPMAVQPDLPSRLLDRRPDLRAAEENLIAANAQIGAAKAALFPTISLTGFYGGQSESLAQLRDGASRIWNTSFAATLPVFDFGRGLARVDQASARQQQALFGYQKAVEAAFREVSDALGNLEYGSRSEARLAEKLRAAQESLELSQLRYQAGYSPYLEVLDAQRTASDAELALIRQRQQRLGYSVDLIKSLGGGWQSAQAQ